MSEIEKTVGVMSHIGWGGEQTTIYKGKPERESPKRTISASGGSGSLQMVSEADTGRCASLLAVLRRGVDTRRCASKDAGSRRGMDCDVPHWLGRRTNHHL